MISNNKQIEIINYVKEYLKKMEKSNIITSLSSYCYFPMWSETPGHAKIKFWMHGKIYLFQFLYIILKNIISIAAHSKYSIHNDSDSDLKYNKLVLSWSVKENFQSDGSFKDKYFNENSNDLPNSKWILISTDGLKKRFENQYFQSEQTKEIYLKRLKYELKIINNMGFAGYFLIVSDFIKWSKEQNIPVGPGRGSGAGSLVAWSLTITNLDPMIWRKFKIATIENNTTMTAAIKGFISKYADGEK